jgi:hypothetical protein
MSEKQSKWPNQKIGSLTTAIPLTRRNKPPPPQTSPPSAPRPTTTCRAAAQSAPRRPLRTTDRRSAHAARNSDPTRVIDEERSACTRLQLVSSRAQRTHLRAGGTSQPSNRRLPPTTSALIPKLPCGNPQRANTIFHARPRYSYVIVHSSKKQPPHVATMV